MQALRDERDTLICMASRSVHLPLDVNAPAMVNLSADWSTEQLRTAVRILSKKTLHIEHQGELLRGPAFSYTDECQPV